MAPLNDEEHLKAYKDALSNWSYDGYIQFELTETAYRWMKRELDGISTRDIGRLMHEYVVAGGEIDEVRETRPEWSDYAFHYDLRFSIQNKPIYIETRLTCQIPWIPDEPIIVVVSIHAP